MPEAGSDEIRAALHIAINAYRVKVGEGWRPIETCPKTSKARLVWCSAWRNTYIVSWTGPLDDNAWPDHARGFWAHFAEGSHSLNQVPTLWQPLPSPPDEVRLSEVDAKIAAADKSNDWLMLNLRCERELIINGLETEYHKGSI